MHLADAFIQSDLQCIQVIHLYCQYVCSLGIKPTTFALLTQCSNHWATGTYIYIYIFMVLYCIYRKYHLSYTHTPHTHTHTQRDRHSQLDSPQCLWISPLSHHKHTHKQSFPQSFIYWSHVGEQHVEALHECHKNQMYCKYHYLEKLQCSFNPLALRWRMSNSWQSNLMKALELLAYSHLDCLPKLLKLDTDSQHCSGC